MFKSFSRKLKRSTVNFLHQLANTLEVEEEVKSSAIEEKTLPVAQVAQHLESEAQNSVDGDDGLIFPGDGDAAELEPGYGRGREMVTAINIQNVQHHSSANGAAAAEQNKSNGNGSEPGASTVTAEQVTSVPLSSADNTLERGSRRRRRRKRGKHKQSAPKTPLALVTGLKNVGRSVSQLTQQPRFWLVFGFGLGAGMGTSALAWGFYQLETMTQVAIADVVTYAPRGTMTIKAANGAILQEIGNVSHDKVTMGEIPPLVEQAFVASEDSRFREHRGIDLQGIMRASLSNVQSGGVMQGGSTITQQLARLVFLTQDRTLARKLKEVRLAQKIETALPKDQILERYLNLIYLGSGAYGVADAAHAYFSKTPEELTLGEAATLAGVVPAPSVYSPRQNLELATRRRNEVLNRMAEVGFITPAEAQAAIAEPLVINPSPLKRFNREAEFFADYILDELRAKLPEEELQQGGLTVNTTLNQQWQEEAQTVLSDAVKRYGRWQRFSEGAMVAMDPRTGAIKMMVGGKDYDASQFNRVTQAKRQPGSTFKPILYGAAIASGISPNKSYLNVPIDIGGYQPANYGDRYTGGNMSLTDALTSSVNVVAVRLLLDVGWNPVINLARQMGITSKLEPTYSLALGAWEMTPLEMTSAYGTFANKGTHVQPYAIQNVVNAQGEVVYKAEHKQTQALDPESNAILTSMMRRVVTSGTGRPAQLGDRQVAGKTGTSDEAKDLWFIGYIPQLVTGVWLGNDNSRPTNGASTTAAMVWGQFMRDATKGMPVQSFPALPKNLDQRKPSIKAEPIKRRVKTLAPPSSPETDGQNTTERPRRHRRTQTDAARPSNIQTARTSAPASAPSAPPRAVSAPAPVAAPAAAPADANAGLPAPPAARKSE
ncbi:penicillin-binding protein 1A [Synechocystis sp. PCC 6803]|uniref:Penicillin-binding protein 1A n=1 Tax=Synechocystis sp. (strain ATCC 27184 / PCC 6803 / Kazusa) TaxID=1111708 RepID=Q55683_SYNY3|nr:MULTISPECIES: transglycosylase domain-containing protein [unclassified Synechocystis]MBD2619728.1 penicillin-binding protein [Synechocystis sp. FACHB-898]MBD2637803.1 penicillin-binding protein [Synechocystis sp. FACHB-908]MBD2662443.1 penicillin-binding protein [Synechocystis sp. FACHB-929]AGF52502.1 penicillin-binding protein 1A [Synechocystis sp. PCC 6803]ALJ68430.1 penicillin-binding protein [Synechocystis sp. PCC 6803]